MADDRGRARGRAPAARRASTAPGRSRRPRQLTRARTRAETVVAATTELLGLSSTRRAAVLAAVLCALALTVSVPLRNYVVQRQELATVTAQQEALAAEVDRLTTERDRLADPAEIAAQARSRLGYVTPGEVPYVVQFPSDGLAAVPDPATDGVPWFQQLWREMEEGPTPAAGVR